MSIDGTCLDVADTAANDRPSAVPAPRVRTARRLSPDPGARARRVRHARHRRRRHRPLLRRRTAPGPRLLGSLPHRACSCSPTGASSASLCGTRPIEPGPTFSGGLSATTSCLSSGASPTARSSLRSTRAQKDRRHRTSGLAFGCGVRARPVASIAGDEETTYRLLTTLLDPKRAPAGELAALYPERWEFEIALDELKTHQRSPASCCARRCPTA